MVQDLWLPNGYKLTDGSKIRAPLFSGDKWQILDTDGDSRILLTYPKLAMKWCDIGLLDNDLFESITFGSMRFLYLSSHKGHAMVPIDNGEPLNNKVDGIAFSLAMKASRHLSKDASFHDAIYIERYTRLLPTWTLSPKVKDEVVLGTWLTGGVVISTESFRRLTQLMGWMPIGDLIEIIEAAGFHVPVGTGRPTKKIPKSEALHNVETAETEEAEVLGKPDAGADSAGHAKFELPGRVYLEKFFNKHIVDIIFNAEKYQALGIGFPSALVLHGPPGSGKTYAVERLAEFLDWPIYSINSNSIGSPYIHETSKKISEVFDKAIETAPAIIIIDEMESFLSERQSGEASGLHHVEEVAEFLRRIPEAINKNVLIIAMTNLIELIDPAILRRGRFDHIIEVKMPSKIEVTALFKSLLSKIPVSGNLDMDVIVNSLAGRALSDSAFVVREAARIAGKAGKTQLDQESIDAALNSLPKDKERKDSHIGFVWGE